jgi:integrase
MKLTAKTVASLKHEGPGHFRDVPDDATPGLYLRIHRTGGKRWTALYKLNRRRRGPVVIGAVDDMSLADARAKMAAWRSLIRQGLDPADEERAKRVEERRLPTVVEFAAEYIERHAKPNKRTWSEDERLLKRNVLPAIGALRLDRVTRRDLVAVLDAIRDRGADVAANRVLAVIRKMFAFGIERGVIAQSPVAGFKSSRETPRERVLTDDEIRALWVATESESSLMEPSTRLALRLLLLTAARAGEVCGARWGEFNGEAPAAWIVPAPRVKNGREHGVPLSDAALAVIEEAGVLRKSEWVFPAARGAGHLTPSGVLHAVWRILDGVTVHDLRRTAATGMQRLGVRLEVTEAVLNHVSGSRAGVTGIYQRHTWADEKRAALNAWAKHVERVVGGEAEDNVVRIQIKA